VGSATENVDKFEGRGGKGTESRGKQPARKQGNQTPYERGLEFAGAPPRKETIKTDAITRATMGSFSAAATAVGKRRKKG